MSARSDEPVRWVGLIRNVMLGREGLHRETLLRLAADAGGVDPLSMLTTGNLLFTVAANRLDRVVDALEHGVATVLGRREPVIVRSLACVRALVGTDPFTPAQHAGWQCEVGLLDHRAPPLDPALLPPTGRTVVVAGHPRELVTARPLAGPDRPHVNTLLERATGFRSTSRGWSTLQRLGGAD